MKKKILALALTLILLVTVFAACQKDSNTDSSSSETTTSSTDKTNEEPKAAFFDAFESETIDGHKVTDETFKGNKVTMVNVWGTFCSPCINEMPALQKLSESYKDKGLCVIGVLCDTFDVYKEENIPEKVQDAKDIISQTGVKYMNILPSVSLNSVKLNSIFSVPTTYFLDENGAIIGSEFVGSRSYEQWCEIIDSII